MLKTKTFIKLHCSLLSVFLCAVGFTVFNTIYVSCVLCLLRQILLLIKIGRYSKPWQIIQGNIKSMPRILELKESLRLAVRNGNLERTRELINYYGISYCAEWLNGYVLLCDALENNRTSVVKLLLKRGSKVNSNSSSTKPSNTPLHLAVSNGNIEIVKLILDKGANMNYINLNGSTPLHIAVCSKKIEMVELLLKHGADVNAGDKYTKETPLHVAIRNNKIHIVKLFLKHGADLSAEDNYNQTPLHKAVGVNSLQIVDLLLNYGASANARQLASCQNKYTSLHMSVKNGPLEMISLLLLRVVKLYVKWGDKITPLHIAAKLGYINITKELLNHGACLHSVTGEGYTPLHFAIQPKNEKMVQLLLNESADINISSKYGYTPLHIATNDGNIGLVKLLLQKGAKVDIEDKDGRTVLYQAVEGKHEVIVDEILKYNPDINNQSNRESLKTAVLGKVVQYCTIFVKLRKYGFTFGPEDVNNSRLLHSVVEKGYLKSLEELLKKGTNVNILNHNGAVGFTLLHCAVKNKKEEIVKVLISYGADVNTRDRHGLTALHYTALIKKDDYDINENAEVAKLLLRKGAYADSQTNDGVTTLQLAIVNGYSRVVEALLEYNSNVNMVDQNYHTPLHLSAEKGFPEICKMLLDKGANVDSKSKGGYTPLHFASEQENFDIVKLLVSKGADINAATKSGLTPLHIATKEYNIGIVRLLLQNGAKVDVEDKDGETVLYLAVNGGHEEIVDEVLKYYPNISNQSYRNSLKIAVLSYGEKNKKIVIKLIQYGFSVGHKNVNSKLLDDFVKKGYFKIVEDLLENGADVNTLYEFMLSKVTGFTLLHSTLKNKKEEIAKILISYESDLNSKDAKKTTIFYGVEILDLKMTNLLLRDRRYKKGRRFNRHIKMNPELLNIAVKKGCIEIIETLLQHGADVNARDGHGRTALYYTALIEKDDFLCYLSPSNTDIDIKGEVAKMLLRKGAEVDAQTNDGVTTLQLAILNGYTKVVEALLEYNSNINIVDQHYRTTLHLSAEKGFPEICKMLLKEGIIVDSKSKDGSTALIKAIKKGHREVVKVLLEWSAEVNYKVENDFTPLHLAVKNGHPKIIRDILKFGADVNSRDKHGRTALHIASIEGHEGAVKTLLRFGSDINILCRNSRTLVGLVQDLIELQQKYYSSGCHVLSCHRRILDYLKKHILKMKIANLYLREENIETLKEYDELFVMECKQEILMLKNQKLADSNITFYDILAKSTNSLAISLRNLNIAQVLNSDNYKKEFPNYAILIESNYRKAMEILGLLDQPDNKLSLL